MAQQHEVKLILGSTGEECDVWDGYQITKSMLESGNPWTFTLWRSTVARSAWNILRERVKCGDWIALTVDGAYQMAGEIETIEYEGARSTGVRMIIGGRDLAAPAIDSDADVRISLRDTTLEDALRRLFEPLGINVTIGVLGDAAREIYRGLRPGVRGATGRTRSRRQKVGRFHPKPGETIWGLAETLCRRVGLMLWISPLEGGRLGVVVDVPNYNQAPVGRLTRRVVDGVVTQDSNILEGSFKVKTHGIPTHVFVLGQSSRGDATAARIRAAVTNGDIYDSEFVSPGLTERHKWVQSYRSKTLSDAMQEGGRMISDAMRDHIRYEALVQGHAVVSQGQSSIYSFDAIFEVHDDVLDVHRNMMVDRVELIGSRSEGQSTKLSLHKIGAIQLSPQPEA